MVLWGNQQCQGTPQVTSCWKPHWRQIHGWVNPRDSGQEKHLPKQTWHGVQMTINSLLFTKRGFKQRGAWWSYFSALFTWKALCIYWCAIQLLYKDHGMILPARLGAMWWVKVTEDDLCFGIVSKFAPKDPFEWDPWLKRKSEDFFHCFLFSLLLLSNKMLLK